MGNFKLYQQSHGSIRLGNMFHAFNSFIARSMDDIISDTKAMIESKFALVLLTLIGVPAYIYAWFLDINVEVWKGIILTSVGAFTGLVIAARYVIKFLTELQEYKRKYRKRTPNKGSNQSVFKLLHFSINTIQHYYFFSKAFLFGPAGYVLYRCLR